MERCCDRASTHVVKVSNKNHILLGALCIAVFAQFILTMAYFARVVRISSLIQLNEAVPIELAAAAVAGLADTLLAVVSVWLLRKARSRFKRTDSIVHRIVTYVIASRVVTAICSLDALIGASAAPRSFGIYTLAVVLLPKCKFFYYPNTSNDIYETKTSYLVHFNCLLAS